MSFEFIPRLHLRGKQTKELLPRPEEDRRIDLMTESKCLETTRSKL